MVYIDKTTFRCYTTQDAEGTRIPHEETFFDGKCQTFIEGYCCIPDGYSLVLDDDTVYLGRMVYPWKDYAELDAAQREYERQQLEEATALVNELIGGVEDVQHE